MMVKILTRFAIHLAQTRSFWARNFDPEIVTIVVMVKFLTRFATHLPQTRPFSARSFGQEIVAIVMRIEFLERCSSTSHKIRSKPHNSLSEAALGRELRNQNGGPPALQVYSSWRFGDVSEGSLEIFQIHKVYLGIKISKSNTNGNWIKLHILETYTLQVDIAEITYRP